MKRSNSIKIMTIEEESSTKEDANSVKNDGMLIS
jgi:hypothetical protein